MAHTHDSAQTYERNAELSAGIAPPEGATAQGDWDSTDNQTKRLCRSILWATYNAGSTIVDIDGFQDETGTVDGPHLSVYGLADDGRLTAAGARRLAEALTTAADKLESLKSCQRCFATPAAVFKAVPL